METMEKVRIAYAEIPKGLYAVMLNTEKYLKECGLPESLIGLVKTRASQINKCGYCLDMHHKDAIRLGETFQRLYLQPAWEESPCFTEAEKAVLNLTDRLTEISKQPVHEIEEAYNRVSQYYSKAEIANIVLAITQINAWNRVAITFGNIPGSYNAG